MLFVTRGVAPGCWALVFQTVLAGFVSFVTQGVAPGCWALVFQTVLAGCVSCCLLPGALPWDVGCWSFRPFVADGFILGFTNK